MYIVVPWIDEMILLGDEPWKNKKIVSKNATPTPRPAITGAFRPLSMILIVSESTFSSFQSVFATNP